MKRCGHTTATRGEWFGLAGLFRGCFSLLLSNEPNTTLCSANKSI